MLFNSYGFLFVFLPVVLALYWKAPSNDARKLVSVAATYFSCGIFNVKFAAVMLFITGSNYLFAGLITRSRGQRRRAWLALSIGLDLGVLALFKYYDFFAGAVNAVAGGPALPLLRVVLPIGISFYTFEAMSYTIDVCREKVAPARRFLDYAHLVTMFPRLVAGPITRYSNIVQQAAELPRRLGWERAAEAARFFTLGMAKKLLIADPLAVRLVDPLFANPGSLGLVSGWVAALAYTVQIYMDFSGYSDMAVGLGLLLGFRLPRNFRLPYASANPAEFWRRWHISLSTWLRDYLFIPLGGSRCGRWRTPLNYFVTMLLGGLWHGANWTFVLWGAYHGVALVVFHRWAGRGAKAGQHTQAPARAAAAASVQGLAGAAVPAASRAASSLRLAGVAVTFAFTAAGWVLFRAPTIWVALSILKGMAGLRGLGLDWDLLGLPPSILTWTLALLGAGLLIGFTVDTWELDAQIAARPRWAIAVAFGLLLVVCLAQLAAPSPFVYFQF
jgi:alginate O-acetyltransferase complex protein AlgI